MKKLFLLADDDNDDAELFGEALTELTPPVDFYRVENGQAMFEFLGSAQNRKPDIIFLDLNMPEISGWQCLSKLKNNPDYKDIPVIMYSTSSVARDKEMAITSGARGFLTKPDNFRTLVKILDNIAHAESANLQKVLQEMAVH